MDDFRQTHPGRSPERRCRPLAASRRWRHGPPALALRRHFATLDGQARRPTHPRLDRHASWPSLRACNSFSPTPPISSPAAAAAAFALGAGNGGDGLRLAELRPFSAFFQRFQALLHRRGLRPGHLGHRPDRAVLGDRPRQHRLGRNRALLARPAADARPALAGRRLRPLSLLRHLTPAGALFRPAMSRTAFGVMADDLVAAPSTPSSSRLAETGAPLTASQHDSGRNWFMIR